jgi:hypothetical protein
LVLHAHLAVLGVIVPDEIFLRAKFSCELAINLEYVENDFTAE